MERTAGIEPAALAWKAKVLPLYDVRFANLSAYLCKKWWREVDSNHRRRSRQIYSLIPLATREPLQILFNTIASVLMVPTAGIELATY
jgi:hypothetical protein